MDFKFLLFTLILSFFVAKLEINIEGKYGWAEKLPTKRFKNKLTKLILQESPLTGYHIWLFSTILLLLHLPFFLEMPWSLGQEFKTVGYFFLFLTVEDFLWFVLNPAFGLRKFAPKHIHWHKKWIGFMPKNYYLGMILSLGLFLMAGIVSR